MVQGNEGYQEFLSVTVHQSHSNQAPMSQPQMNQTQAIQSQPIATSPTPEKGLLHCPFLTM